MMYSTDVFHYWHSRFWGAGKLPADGFECSLNINLRNREAAVTATDRTVLSRLLSGLLCTLSSRAVFLSLLSQVSEREDRGKVGAWFFQVFSGLSLLALMQLVRELSFEKKQWLVVFDEQLLPVNSPLPLFSPLLTDAPFLFGTKPYQPPSPDEGFEF